MSYKRYSEYKDSGIEWIGEIPKEWNCIQVKHLFFIGRGRVISQLELMDDGIYPVYSSQTSNDGCLGYIKTYDFDVPLLTWTTDGANAGTIFLRTGKFNCTNVCGTLRKKNDDVDMRYVLYNLSYTAHYHKRLDTNGYKIMNNEMAAIQLCVPSLHEQQSIASYLDTQCTLIDKAIETQNKIIEKLKEYKKSIITEAVTKGLDKNAKMKDSGIEWIGKIPEGWGVRKVKFLFKVISGSTPKSDNPTFWDGDIIWITPTDYTTESKYISDSIKKITEDGLKSCSLTLVPVNSIIFSKRAPIGLVAISTKELCTNQGCLACIPINVMTSFYYYIMSIATDVFQSKGKGTTFMEISLFDFKNMRLVLPTYKEQKLIVQYLDHKTEQIDQLILSKEQIIEKLQNFKKSLIYECVTGKRRV